MASTPGFPPGNGGFDSPTSCQGGFMTAKRTSKNPPAGKPTVGERLANIEKALGAQLQLIDTHTHEVRSQSAGTLIETSKAIQEAPEVID